MNPLPTVLLVRGSILHFLADPGIEGDPAAWQYFEDGALLLQEGRVAACGDWACALAAMPERQGEAACYYDYRGKLILPGFVDTHTHYSQMRVQGSSASAAGLAGALRTPRRNRTG